jgi:hypothetical protein
MDTFAFACLFVFGLVWWHPQRAERVETSFYLTMLGICILMVYLHDYAFSENTFKNDNTFKNIPICYK